MSRIQQLAKSYGQHIATAWQRTIADSQRVIIIVYDKELERDILAHKGEFEIVTKQANHDWIEVNVAPAFAEWIAATEYRDAYFESPDDLQLKLESDFTSFVANKIRAALAARMLPKAPLFRSSASAAYLRSPGFLKF